MSFFFFFFSLFFFNLIKIKYNPFIEYKPEKISKFLNSQLNVKLDEKALNKLTNKFGEAIFNLVILSGKTGTYRLEASSVDVSVKSSPFTLINPIVSVGFINFTAQTIETESLDRMILLPIQPIVNLSYLKDQTVRKKEVIVKGIKNK